LSFSTQFNNLRIFKRSRRLKGKPAWQDEIPPLKEAKDTYRIAAKHQGKFRSAFLNAVKNILPDKMPKEFKESYNQGTQVEAMNSLPLFQDGTDAQNQAEQRFIDNLEQAYIDVLQESGETETRNMNKEFDTKLGFSVVPLAKAKVTPVMISEGRQRAREAARGFIVPVNPYSIEWMRERSLTLVREGITKQQKLVVNDILSDAFEKGLRAEETYKSIKANIGLTNREFNAVLNRRSLLEDADLPTERVEQFTNKYRDELLKRRAERISRTETISAQAQGRKDSWRMAEEAGQLPPVEREWVSAPPSPNPNRPCEICLDLDGRRASVNGTYTSLEGEVDGPPAHPSCRCSEILRKSGTASLPKPARRLPGVPPPEKKPIAMPPELKPKRRE
jgi:hypothetical protein